MCVNDLSAGLRRDNGRMKILMPLSYEFTENVTVSDRINSPYLLTALLFTALLTKPLVAILVQEQDSFQVRLQNTAALESSVSKTVMWALALLIIICLFFFQIFIIMYFIHIIIWHNITYFIICIFFKMISTLPCNILLITSFFLLLLCQEVKRPPSPMPSLPPGWPMPSRPPVRRATWATAAATRRSRVSTV